MADFDVEKAREKAFFKLNVNDDLVLACDEIERLRSDVKRLTDMSHEQLDKLCLRTERDKWKARCEELEVAFGAARENRGEWKAKAERYERALRLIHAAITEAPQRALSADAQWAGDVAGNALSPSPAQAEQRGVFVTREKLAAASAQASDEAKRGDGFCVTWFERLATALGLPDRDAASGGGEGAE